MATVEVRDGRPVAVRTGGDELRREAAILRTLAGPGVPTVVELDDDGTVVRLVTTVAPPLPTADVPRSLAQLAEVLTRAHAAGIAHGPVREEHLLGSPGCLLVTGWDPSAEPADDIAHLGHLLQRHAGDDAHLQAVAARATAPDGPTMAALAQALRAGPQPVHRPVPVTVLAGLALALALVAVGLLTRGSGSGSGRSRPPAAAAIPHPAPPSTTSTAPPERPAPEIGIDGTVVTRDGGRWTIGRPGDVVVVGDWDCDGTATPAVLRPTTGQVWLFSRWAEDGRPEAGRSAGTVVGATRARARPADGCDRLEVATAEGQSTTVG